MKLVDREIIIITDKFKRYSNLLNFNNFSV
jgi:hypothetical protein